MTRASAPSLWLAAAAWIDRVLRCAADRLLATCAGNTLRLVDGRRVLLREAAAQDGEAIQDFIGGLSPASRRKRFFSAVRALSDEALRDLTHFDATRESVLLARAPASRAVVGLAQYAQADARSAEVAVVVADAWRGAGLGRMMLEALLGRARRTGYEAAVGELLADNWDMRGLARRLGFDILAIPGDAEMLSIRRSLTAVPQRCRSATA